MWVRVRYSLVGKASRKIKFGGFYLPHISKKPTIFKGKFKLKKIQYYSKQESKRIQIPPIQSLAPLVKSIYQNWNIFIKAFKKCKLQCFEKWTITVTSKKNSCTYSCTRCLRDKSTPIKCSKENCVVPSAVPPEIQGLTQCEKMLSALAFSVMHVLSHDIARWATNDILLFFRMIYRK